MSGASNAVFLSYASEDAEAAGPIAEALRAVGIEVWFDKSELRGGDAWDRQIRDQIHDCRLFIAVISAHTEARDEGYFRREWRLAVERAGDMHERKSFLVPVVVDGTSERGAAVPEKFRELQWTRLPGGETTPAFVDLIRTRLSLNFSHVAAASHAASSSPLGKPSGTQHFKTSNRPLLILAAAAICLMGAYIVVDRVGSKRPVVAPAPPAGASAAAPEPDSGRTSDKSVAVLPLKNESGDPKQDYFSDGLSEDLISALSHVPDLKVIGRTSSFHFRNSTEDSASIGRQLGVSRLIEGSVQSDGNTIRVRTELINASDGRTLWAERYDRPYKSLFGLQDEITQAVALALKIHLLPSATNSTNSDRPPSESLDAYNALIEGKFYAQRETEDYYRRAIASYNRATVIDPQYALAWSGLSREWARLGLNYLSGARQRAAIAKAREAAEHALDIAPRLAAAHLAKGYLLKYVDLDWRGAEEEFRRALTLAPNDADAIWYVAAQLATRGELKGAIELSRRALAIDPGRSLWYKWLGLYLAGLKQFDQAAEMMQMAVSLEQPTGINEYAVDVTFIAAVRGDSQAALVAARQALPDARPIALAMALQIAGNRIAADEALKNLVAINSDSYWIADVYALRGEADKTFEWLDRAWSDRDSAIWQLHFDPLVLRYKDDPRFAAFCRKVGLPTPAEVAAQNNGKST